MDFTGASTYGGAPMRQPTHTNGPDAGNQMGARTDTRATKTAVVHNPTLWLVALLGVAIGLISVTLRVGK